MRVHVNLHIPTCMYMVVCFLGGMLIADFYAIGILSLTFHRPLSDDFQQGEFHCAAPVSSEDIFFSVLIN